MLYEVYLILSHLLIKAAECNSEQSLYNFSGSRTAWSYCNSQLNFIQLLKGL